VISKYQQEQQMMADVFP